MARKLDINDVTTPEEAAEVLLSVYGDKASETAEFRIRKAHDSSSAIFWRRVQNLLASMRL